MQLLSVSNVSRTLGAAVITATSSASFMLSLPGKALAEPGAPDVTSQMTLIGTPYGSYGPYARNAWDLALSGNKLYIGGGNSANSGPSLRPGPMPIVSVDLITNGFKSEFLSNEDQIDRFVNLNGTLTVPGHDPRDGQDKGNFYPLGATGWSKVRTIPYGVHTYDMEYFGGKTFAALGTDGTRASIVQSTDGGQKWTNAVDSPYPQRVYDLFTYNGELFAATLSYPNSSYFNSIKQVMKYNGTKFVPLAGVYVDQMYPDRPSGTLYARMQSPTEVGGSLYYIGGVPANDHAMDPFALYQAASVGSATKVNLPDAAAKPYDVLAYNGNVEVLTSSKQADGSYRIRVYSSQGGSSVWQEVFNFSAPTIARSFTRNAGHYYVGLGTTVDEVSPASGRLYDIDLSKIPSPVQ